MRRKVDLQAEADSVDLPAPGDGGLRGRKAGGRGNRENVAGVEELTCACWMEKNIFNDLLLERLNRFQPLQPGDLVIMGIEGVDLDDSVFSHGQGVVRIHKIYPIL